MEAKNGEAMTYAEQEAWANSSEVTISLCAKCGHRQREHQGRGHYLVPNGPCLLCPASMDGQKTCNEYVPQ